MLKILIFVCSVVNLLKDDESSSNQNQLLIRNIGLTDVRGKIFKLWKICVNNFNYMSEFFESIKVFLNDLNLNCVLFKNNL